jgi:preprotein translocase subunit SecE
MGAQRKPAVKEPKEQSASRTAQQTARQVRNAATPAKTAAPGAKPAVSGKAAQNPKNQEKEKSVITQRGERVAQIVRDTRSELRKVTWPDRDTTRNLTLLVIGVSTVLGLLLGGIDFGLLKLFEAL